MEQKRFSIQALLKSRDFRLVFPTFVAIIAAAIAFGQSWLFMLPLYVSLCVMLLQAHANRYCFLLGSLNSILYAAVYWQQGLHSMAVYALAVSFPLQAVTFLRWNQRAWGQATLFKRMPARTRALAALACIALWAILYAVFSALGSAYLILDNTVTILGITSTLLSMLSYIEFPYVSLASSAISLVLYGQMMLVQPAQSTYFIFMGYSIVCSVRALKQMQRLYQQQTAEKQARP